MSPVGSAGDILSTAVGTDVRGRSPRGVRAAMYGAAQRPGQTKASDQRTGGGTGAGPGFCAIWPGIGGRGGGGSAAPRIGGGGTGARRASAGRGAGRGAGGRK